MQTRPLGESERPSLHRQSLGLCDSMAVRHARVMLPPTPAPTPTPTPAAPPAPSPVPASAPAMTAMHSVPADVIVQIKREILMSYFTRQVEAGKWLLGSLLIVNGGAIAGLLAAENIPAVALASSGKWFVSGLCAAFASGIFSWAMADITISMLRHQLGIEFVDHDSTLNFKGAERLGDFCGAMAFICVVGSLGAFVTGALDVSDFVATIKPK